MNNRLPILAAEVRRAHEGVLDAAKTAAERAIEAGNSLIEAKTLLPHGEWLPWLRATGVSERTAQRYMALARSRLGSDTVSLLGGVMPALRFVRLREQAHHHLKEAEAAAQAGATGDDELVPLEVALMLMDEMVAMFPPYEGTAQ